MKIKGKSVEKLISWLARASQAGRTDTPKFKHVVGAVRRATGVERVSKFYAF